MTIKQTLGELHKLLASWGMGEDDWFLILHYCDILQGYNLKYNCDEHLHIMIRHDRLPWRSSRRQWDKETWMPPSSPYERSFRQFIRTTGYDFHCFVGDPSTFSTIRRRYSIRYCVPGGHMRMATTLGNLYFWRRHVREYVRVYSADVMRRRFLWIEGLHAMAIRKGDQPVVQATRYLLRYRPSDTSVDQRLQTRMSHWHATGELNGTTGYPGRVRGRVWLITNPDRPPAIRRGQILVAKLTSPKLVPHINQSSAVVTDEGGKLAHATVYCREAKIPCVVGIKIATKVLRDGDRVEVDANRGVVRKL